ncbi:defensin-like protein CAL1 [Typha latifolia]|uniref:defensin-like protein CAL1 n=1 Tax=Typha latifolia TaxID=4733 RepID=UPI003C2CA21D
MEKSRGIMAPAILFCLFLLVASEMGTMTVEARHCESQSHKFKGMCLSENNCANVCHTEGFPDGTCKTQGIHRRCFCRRVC